MTNWQEKWEETQRKFGGAGLTRTRTVNEKEEDKDFGVFGHIADIALAPIRGVEGMVQDVYGLADTLTGDALPDWDTRLFGESETIAGGLIEGIANFAAGFVPVLGWVGRGAKVGRTISLAKGLTYSKQAAAKAAGFSGVRGGSGLATLAKGVSGPVQAFKGPLGSAGIDVTRAAVASAITDFNVFDGHEARLSNLVQNYPWLANPVTEFLAADEDDHELVGRFKSSLEGFGLGSIIDTLVLSLRHMRAGTNAKALGASPEEATRAADDIVDPENIRSNLEDMGSSNNGELKDPYSFANIVEDSRETRNLQNRYGGQARGTYKGTLGIGGKVGLTKKSQLTSIRRILTMGAEQGEAGKHWYERSGQEILKLTGGSVKEADKIAQLVAIFSPNTSIEINMEQALQAYYRSKRMSKEAFLSGPARIAMGGQQKQAARVLYDGESILDFSGGRKIRNFYNDFISGIDPTRSRAKAATIDLWMARFFNYAPTKTPKGGAHWTVTDLQYDFMLTRIKEVADDLGWEMHQVQAATWSYGKVLWESMAKEVDVAAKKAGITGSLEDNLKYGEFYLAQFQKRLNKEFKSTSRFKSTEAFDLSSIIRSKSVILSDTTLPSPGSGVLEGLHSATWVTKQQYLADMTAVRLGDDGQDIVEEALGFGSRTKFSPQDQTLIAAPKSVKGGVKAVMDLKGSKIEPIALAQARAYAMVDGLYHGNNNVSGVQIFEGGDVLKSKSNAVKITFGRRRSDNDLEAIQEAVRNAFGTTKLIISPLDDGFVIINPGSGKSGPFLKLARGLADDLTLPEATIARTDAHAEHFSISSGTPDGSGFRPQLEKEGHAEALKRLDIVYGPDVAKAQRKYASEGFGESPQVPDLPTAAVTEGGPRRATTALDRNATKIADADGNAVPLNSDGTITLYHRTYKENAQTIRDTGSFQQADFVEGPMPSSRAVNPAIRTNRPILFSTTETGAGRGDWYGKHGVVKVKINPMHVTVESAWRDGEVWVRVEADARSNLEVDQSLATFSKETISAANKTARPHKSTAVSKAARRLASKFMPEGGAILDFGAGKWGTKPGGWSEANYYGKGLMDDGYDVTLYDFGENAGPLHSPGALNKQYDMVMVSNVVNVQRTAKELDSTIEQIARATNLNGGRVIINLPRSPRKGAFEGMTATEGSEYLRGKLLERFSKVELVGGTKAEPTFMVEGKLLDPHSDGILNPKFEEVAPGISDLKVTVEELGVDPAKLKNADLVTHLVQLRYGGEIVESSASGRRWNRMANGTEVDLTSEAHGGNGWDPIIEEGAVRTVKENPASIAKAKKLDQEVALKQQDDPLLDEVVSRSELNSERSAKAKESVGLTPEQTKERKSGLKQILKKLKEESRAERQEGAGVLLQDELLIKRFITAVGEDVVEDVSLSIRPDYEGNLGSFYYFRNLVTISRKAVKDGEVADTMIHELWHHMSRYVDDGMVAKLRKQFEKEKAAWQKLSIGDKADLAFEKGGNYEYRWTDFDEWFAETLKEKSLKKLRDWDDGPKSLLLHAKRVLLEIFAAIKSKFGFDHTQKVVNDFFNRKINVTKKQRPFGFDRARKSFSKKGQVPDIPDARIGLLRPLGITQNLAKTILRNVDMRLDNGFDLGIDPQARIKLPNGTSVYKYSKTELLDRHLERSDMNLSHYSGAADAMAITRTYEDLYRSTVSADMDVLSPKTYQDQLDSALEELRIMVGVTARDDQSLQLHIMRGIKDDVKQLELINARVLAYKRLQLTMSQLLASDVKAWKAGGNSETAEALLRSHAEFFVNLTAGIKGLNTLHGRGLGSGNIPIQGVIQDPVALADFLRQRGGRKSTDRLVNMLDLALNDTGTGLLNSHHIGAMNRLLKPSFTNRIMNLTNTYWINQILSGGQTLFINGFGGVLTSIYRPLEGMLGASITLNGAAFTDYASELGYLFLHAQDAFKMAWKSAKMSENILDPGRRVLDTVGAGNAMDPANFGIKGDTVFGAGTRYLGNFLQLPSRILLSTDEFFKQMNYRAVGHRKLLREGMAMGKQGHELAEHIHERMALLVEDGQAYSASQAYKRGVKAAKESGIVDPSEVRSYAIEYTQRPPEHGGFDRNLDAISKEALDVAEEVTFTRALAKDSLPAWIQRLAIQSPWMRFIIPFVRTPMNIAYSAGQRFDIPGAARVVYHKLRKEDIHLRSAQNRMMRDMGSGDPAKRAAATGRMAAGVMASYYLFGKASEGVISGRGPADKEMRQILKDGGWQPYSVKTKEGWLSYSRVDPFATVIGTIADIHDHIRYSPIEDQEEASTAIAGLAIALAQNFTNKTYLAGISNVLQALDAPDRHMAKLARTYASSMLPFSSFQGQSLYAFGDEYMRDVQSMNEALMAKTPFYSDQVRPLRNFLGEEVRRTTSVGTDSVSSVLDMFFPLHYTQTKNDILSEEFRVLGHGFTPPKNVKMGLRLTDYIQPKGHEREGQDAFDRWQQLYGTIKDRRRTLEPTLLKLIKSRKYQRLTPLSDFKAQSPRIAQINSVLSNFKSVAWDQLLKEYPSLNRDYIDIFTTRKKRRRGQTFGGF